MENLNGTLKLSGNLTGEEIPVIIKEKTVVEKNYENLDNKPSINDVILEGNKTPAELGLTKASDFELYKQSVDRSFRGVSESIRSVKTESKTYTDNAIEAAKAYSDGKNSDLETAINETINNKNNGTRAYASHLVSEESDARKTADEETLTASKSYTDTAVVKEVTKGPASSLEFEGLQEGIPFPKIILTVPDEYVYAEGKTAHSISIYCNNYADPDATELYSENMLVVAKSNTVEIGYDDTIKLLKQVPGKCVVGFSNEEDAAVCTLTVTGALKYEALKRIYSECWNRMDVEKDNMEGYVRGYTDTEITKCKEYTDEKIAEGGNVTAAGNPVQLDGLQGGVPFSEMVVSGKNLFDGNLIIGIVQVGTGNITGGSQYLSTPNYISVNGDCTYSLSNFENKQFDAVVFYDSNKSYISATPLNRVEPLISHFTTPKNCKYIRWRYFFDNAASIDMLSEIQLELGDTATEYEPPITGRELTVNACGKNLLINKSSTITWNGVTATVNDDGSVTINRTASSDLNAYLVLWNNIPARDVASQKITINAINGQSLTTCYMGVDRLENATYINRIAVGLINNGVGIVTQEDVDNDRIFRTWIFINKDYAPNNLIVYPQLELGSTATEYEPYHGSTTTITPDSNPYVIPNDIRQQDGLNNISVSAGTLSATGVRKNAALKRVWKEMDDFNAKIGSINTILESVTGGAE